MKSMERMMKDIARMSANSDESFSSAIAESSTSVNAAEPVQPKSRSLRKGLLSALGCSLLALGASGAEVTWTGGGGADNRWLTGANWSTGTVPANGDDAVFVNASGAPVTVDVSDNRVIREILVRGAGDVTLNIASGMRLRVSNTGAMGIQVYNGSLTVNGPGTLGHSTNGTGAGNLNNLDDGVAVGRTLTINAQIVDAADTAGNATGFETWIADSGKGGTVVLGNPANAFTLGVAIGNGHVLVASKLANTGTPSSIGAGPNVAPNLGGILRYTGTGDSTDRTFLLNGGNVLLGFGGGIEQAGTGVLTWSGAAYNNTAAAQTLLLLGNSASAAYFTGNIYNNQTAPNVLSIEKSGTGSWTLSGNNSFTGGILVNGGTLGLGSATAASTAAQITLAGGTTLSISPSLTMTLPAVTVAGSATISVGNSAAVTFSRLTGPAVTLTLGSGAKAFVSGLPAGLIGPWLTLNGGPAEYSLSLGIIPAVTALSPVALATKGNPLPNGPAIQAVISAAGAGPDISLTADPTALFSLTQAVLTDYATVALGGKTLLANALAMTANADALTIGASPGDGALLPSGLVPPATPPSAAAVLALGPVIWYDPSDTATVALNASGQVTNLLNKGLWASAQNAVVRSGHTGPYYATGAESHSPRPMLRNNVANQGLQSAANTGITGAAPRTLVSVQSRLPDSMVSMGAGTSGNAFENYLLAANIRFGTYSGDINIAPAPEATPVVMVFQNGVGGDNSTYQGFADGVPTGTSSRNDLNTTDTPLCLGHRNGGGTYVGQIGEVLLFDRTLNTTERQTLEAYLLAKWKNPSPGVTASQQNGVLTLRNDSTLAPLTVNAALNAAYDTAISLAKTGPGDVTLAGGVRLAGPVVIDQGALTFDTPAGLADALLGITAGAGKLVKAGPGGLTLPPTVANVYSGGTDITGGSVQVGNNRSLGTGPVNISGGGTLDIGGGTAVNSLIITNPVSVSGMGVGGLGAIVNNGPVAQRYAFENTTITLTGDAAIGGTLNDRWDIAANLTTTPSLATLDLGGHTLFKKGVTDFRISPATVANAPLASAGPAFHIQQGRICIEHGTPLLPNDNQREIRIDGEGSFGLYQATVPLNWAITAANGAQIWAYGGNELTNQNTLAGLITIPASGSLLHLTSSGTFNKIFTGKITGPGGLRVRDGGTRAMSLLLNTANDFTGPVTVNNAVLGLRYPAALPNHNNLQNLEANGAIRFFMGGPGEWTSADVATLANRGGFFNANSQCFQIQVPQGRTGTLTDAIGNSGFLPRFDKYGSGTLVIDADITFGASVGSPRIHNGTTVLTNNTTWYGGRGALCLPDPAVSDDTGLANPTLIVRDNAQYISEDIGYLTTTVPTIRPGHTGGRSLVELRDNGFIKTGIWGGNASDGSGAIYQSGNSHWLCTSGQGNDGKLGTAGYCFWQLDGGLITFKGYTTLGWNNSTASVGILRQTGGHIQFDGQRVAVPANGTVGDSYGGQIDLSRGGIGVLHLEGGTVLHHGNLRLLSGSGGSDSTGANGTGIMTVTGTADAVIDRQIEMGNRSGGFASLNLNGGKLTATYILRNGQTNSTTAVSFNGGTLCVTNNSGNQYLFAVDSPANFDAIGKNPIPLHIYKGGGTIELGENVTRIIDRPLMKPEGAGIASIPINAAGAGYVAPPYVSITGGGMGATAIAHINRTTGALTGIEVTSPGWGYSTNTPTVTLVGGNPTTAASLNPPLYAEQGNGGLTKTGLGTLILSAANTYEGPTRVEGGTLILRHPKALHPKSEIIIGDGTLDLGGYTFTNVSVTVSGSGGIVNGKIVTASAVKTGNGTATWDAAIEFAAVAPGLIPGLWEGRRRGINGDYWRLDYPNPKSSVQLTTRAGNFDAPNAGNGNSDRAQFWSGNYNMWIYTGYLWNRTATNETWTWRASFDDNAALKIDNILLINMGGAGPTYRSYTLTPGPHPIEIRFGDGTGSVGPYTGHGGMLYDRYGRNYQSTDNAALRNYYARLEDDVDENGQHLLTVNLDHEARPTHNAIQVQEGTLLLPTAQPGLWEGHRQVPASPYWDLNFPNPKDGGIQPTTRAGNYDGPAASNGNSDRSQFWAGNYNMWIYTGYVWNRSATNETWTWRGIFDDNASLKIDGLQLINTGNSPVYVNYTLTPGAHPIEIRFGDGTGAVGPGSGNGGMVYDPYGRNQQSTDLATVRTYYQRLATDIDANGRHLITATPYGGADVLSGATISVSNGATLDLGGQTREGLTVSGNGAVINGTPGPGFIISPAGDDLTGTLSVDNLTTLSGATYRVTVHDPQPLPPTPPPTPVYTPGLRASGKITSPAWDLAFPNAGTAVVLTPEAANITKGPNSSGDAYRNGFWSGGNCMHIYTGYIWNRASTNVTYTWRLTFDDHCSLKIDDWEQYVPLGWGVTYVDHTLTPGAHRIEVRFGEIGGDVGPASGQSGILYDPLGRGYVSNDNNLLPNYYRLLADPGDGTLLTVEGPPPPPQAPSDDGLNDVITSAGWLNLTGLTIEPSDLRSATPPGTKYVIARAPGFTGTPIIQGFDDGRKWITLRKGPELWLTTKSGTVLILR